MTDTLLQKGHYTDKPSWTEQCPSQKRANRIGHNQSNIDDLRHEIAKTDDLLRDNLKLDNPERQIRINEHTPTRQKLQGMLTFLLKQIKHIQRRYKFTNTNNNTSDSTQPSTTRAYIYQLLRHKSYSSRLPHPTSYQKTVFMNFYRKPWPTTLLNVSPYLIWLQPTKMS